MSYEEIGDLCREASIEKQNCLLIHLLYFEQKILYVMNKVMNINFSSLQQICLFTRSDYILMLGNILFHLSLTGMF